MTEKILSPGGGIKKNFHRERVEVLFKTGQAGFRGSIFLRGSLPEKVLKKICSGFSVFGLSALLLFATMI